jgi:hypothetical protein
MRTPRIAYVISGAASVADSPDNPAFMVAWWRRDEQGRTWLAWRLTTAFSFGAAGADA